MKTVPLNDVLLMFYHISFKLKQLEEQESEVIRMQIHIY